MNAASTTAPSRPSGAVAKVFFNNKGVAAKETDQCADYPPDDMSVWD